MRPVDKTEQKQPFLGGAQVRKKKKLIFKNYTEREVKHVRI